MSMNKITLTVTIETDFDNFTHSVKLLNNSGQVVKEFTAEDDPTLFVDLKERINEFWQEIYVDGWDG